MRECVYVTVCGACVCMRLWGGVSAWLCQMCGCEYEHFNHHTCHCDKSDNNIQH